ncbi:MAG: alpha/beta fold hydrolase [Armatimonadota bacterium]|nr:alpha/beta fold hydrolase [bacterium]
MARTVKSEEFFRSKVDGFKDRYLIEYPEEHPTGPLVFYMHSGLVRAEQGFRDGHEWDIRRLRNEVMERNGVYVCPDYRGNSWLNAPAETDMLDLLNDLKQKFSISRVIVTGASMGGTAALVFTAHHADLVDGVIALCPATDMSALYYDMSTRKDWMLKHLAKALIKSYGGTPDEVPDEYIYHSAIHNVSRFTMPIAIRHGDADAILPIEKTREFVEVLRAVGARVHYDEVFGGDHYSPTVMTPWKEYLDFVLS